MKATKLFILFFAINMRLYSQENKTTWSKILNIPKSKNKIGLNYNVDCFNAFNFNLEPQFGGLFDTYLKEVKGISNLNKIYDRSDLGFNLNIPQKLTDDLILNAKYNVGMFKFRDHCDYTMGGYVLRVSLKYNF